jgi:hypothetical protein
MTPEIRALLVELKGWTRPDGANVEVTSKWSMRAAAILAAEKTARPTAPAEPNPYADNRGYGAEGAERAAQAEANWPNDAALDRAVDLCVGRWAGTMRATLDMGAALESLGVATTKKIEDAAFKAWVAAPLPTNFPNSKLCQRNAMKEAWRAAQAEIRRPQTIVDDPVRHGLRANALIGGLMEHSRGYYTNSLNAWRSDLLEQLRKLMARYARMERMHHPDKADQGRLIELTKRMIAMVENAVVVAATPSAPPPPRAEPPPSTEPDERPKPRAEAGEWPVRAHWR